MIYEQGTILIVIKLSTILSFFKLNTYINFVRSTAFYIFILRNTIVESSIVLDSRGREIQILGGVPMDNPIKKCSSVYPFCLRREGGREGKMNLCTRLEVKGVVTAKTTTLRR